MASIKFPCKQSVPRMVSWSPPDIGLLKCNVDGASKGNPGPCGVGGVIRDANRKILGFFALNTGWGWAYEAKIKAILHGFRFCHQYLLRNIIIESDSTTAVRWTSSKNRRPWKLANELNQIDTWMEEVNCLGVKHILREGNGLADFRANKGCERISPLWIFLGTSENPGRL